LGRAAARTRSRAGSSVGWRGGFVIPITAS